MLIKCSFLQVAITEILFFKNETFSREKWAKQRLTILLAVNISGTEKLSLLTRENSQKLHYFKGIKLLPVIYKAIVRHG